MAASGNNRFAVTCARMRQFMREQNRQVRMGDIVGSSFQRPVQLTPPVAAAASRVISDRTLQLFPAYTTGKEIMMQEEINMATLTIFYQGQVATFHNFPADRAKELMQMAGSMTEQAPEQGLTMTTAVPGKAEPCEEPSAGEDMPPIARKLTLQRFLKKRMYRIGGTDDPDHNEDDYSPLKKRDSAGGNPSEDVPDDDASWLRL